MIEAAGEDRNEDPNRVRVGLDVSGLDPAYKRHAIRGIGRYVAALSRYFRSTELGEVTVGEFDHSAFSSPPFLDRLGPRLGLRPHTLEQHLVYPVQMRGERFRDYDLLHIPAQTDAPAWVTRPYVLTVMDLIPFAFPEEYRGSATRASFWMSRGIERAAIRRARLLIVPSHFTRGDLIRRLAVPPERILVTPLATDPLFFERPPLGEIEAARNRTGLPMDREIVLYVGGIDPRKNVQGLLRIYQQVLRARKEKGRRGPVLVMAGDILRDRSFPALDAAIRKLGLQGRVLFPGYLTEAHLRALYAVSDVFLFPSLYEGFGLPPLEAMAAGLPVVSSDRSALPEVMGDAGILFSPHDEDAGTRGVLEVLDHPSRARELSRRGTQRARRFSWKHLGESTARAYAATRGLR